MYIKNMKRIFVVLAAVAFTVATGAVWQVSAQNPELEERITLSPASEELTLQAGTKKSGKITVINDGDVDYTFKAYVAPFSVDGEDYNPNFTIVNERTRASQWITLYKQSASLAAGKRTVIDYVVDVPDNAAPGGHYAVLFAETQPSGDSANIARKKRVGTLLYMAVDGEMQRSGSLESLTTSLWQTKAPVTSDIRIKNDGNVHFTANVNAHYTNIFGRQQFQLKKETRIMPGTTRRVPVNWQDAPYFGIFKTGGDIAYLDTTEELPSKYIILLPYPILAGVLGAVVLLVVYGIVKRKRSSRGRTNFASKAKRR